eukprot:6209270-Pleurochrysis_carterae.AAC.3
MVGDVRSSHRGHVEDASNELMRGLALLIVRTVGLGGYNAEPTEIAYPLGFVDKPSKSSNQFAQRLIRQEAVTLPTPTP